MSKFTRVRNYYLEIYPDYQNCLLDDYNWDRLTHWDRVRPEILEESFKEDKRILKNMVQDGLFNSLESDRKYLNNDAVTLWDFADFIDGEICWKI